MWSDLMQGANRSLSAEPFPEYEALRIRCVEFARQHPPLALENELVDTIRGSESRPLPMQGDVSLVEMDLQVASGGRHAVGGDHGVSTANRFPGCAHGPAHIVTLDLSDPALVELSLSKDLLSWSAIPFVYPYCQHCDAWLTNVTMSLCDGILVIEDDAQSDAQNHAQPKSRCTATSPTLYRQATEASVGVRSPLSREREVLRIGGSPTWLQDRAQWPSSDGDWLFLAEHRGPGSAFMYFFVDAKRKRMATTMQLT